MREIKFRAWDVTQQQYVSEYDTGDYSPVEFNSKGNATTSYKDLGCACDPSNACGGCYDEWVEAENIIVEQFTGLTDCNGVDIYEGDRVQISKDSYGGQRGEIDTVDLSGFRLWLENEEFGYEGERLVNPEQCKIIGTIHDTEGKL